MKRLLLLLLIACGDAKPSARVMDEASLGALAFPLTEGTPAARAHFTRGLLALHSFWYDEARREFEAAIAADPKMNMAHWGVAMSHIKLLWGEDDVAAAKAALKAMPDPEKLSVREQTWVFATIALLKADDVQAGRKAFVAQIEDIYRRDHDDESATFLAIALLATTRPGDADNFIKRGRAATLAAEVFAKNPKHPGAAHYLLHAKDTPELAAEALSAARAYAAIAPQAFHARHMPAHIFSRLGMWADAIASCEAAWDASLAAARRAKLSANHHDFHSLAWLVELPFELGQRKRAEGALQTFGAAVKAGLSRQHRALYALAVSSYMVRTGGWSRVDELLAPLASPAVEELATDLRTGGPSRCGPGSPNQLLEDLALLDARMRAAAARHDGALTATLASQSDAVRAKLRPVVEAAQAPATIAAVDAINERARKALLARAAGDDAALAKILRESVTDSDLEITGENNPSGFSVREELGDVLLRTNDFAGAAEAYEAQLKRQPHRARALLGAARARAKAGDAAAAHRWYQQLAALWASADPSSDLDEARTN